jgi:hypothetical protein
MTGRLNPSVFHLGGVEIGRDVAGCGCSCKVCEELLGRIELGVNDDMVGGEVDKTG